MKITDVTLTLFSWESIPSTIYGHHTARPTGQSDLGLLRVVTDEGVEGHAFLGTSSNPASLDGPGLIRFLMEDCCSGRPEICAPLIESITPCCPPKRASYAPAASA